MTDRARGFVCGLFGAALFGASAPLAKLLLPGTGPVALAGLLYLGAAGGVWLARLLRGKTREAPLRASDAGLLSGISVVGGIIGPILLLVGLRRVSAGAASLLLNLEAPLTIFIAAALFREHVGRRAWLATVLILAGSLLIAYRPNDLAAGWQGALAIGGACLCWGIDNNLTQRLSMRDPLAIVSWKASVAGSVSLAIALATRQPFPRPTLIGAALLLGALGYGLSIVLDVLAFRLLGAAREAAIFATAPFMGAVFSIPLFGEWPGFTGGVAMAFMALGAWLLARERHGHLHEHEPLDHEHLHVHDEHHQHDHPPGVDPREPHSHPHRHAAMTHEHPHVPDLHHRHKH